MTTPRPFPVRDTTNTAGEDACVTPQWKGGGGGGKWKKVAWL